ncbi:MAG: PaaX family transcriptional regulator C-terminal domain-containing protein [Patescibacteria group bacterium]|nr:PaaX family transcriptional regulator C-terminal domain-containing protein [Patescibacteria group bacterium]
MDKKNKKKEIAEIVLKITDGLFCSLTDLALWNLFYIAELSPLRHPSDIGKAKFFADKNFEKFNYLTLKQALYKIKSKGWIKEDLCLTKKGAQRLNNFIPIYSKKRKWNKNWYLVSYDIPEIKRKYRNILRHNLKELGFGEVHASLWISPFDFSKDVEKIVDYYHLSRFVILAVSNKIGKEESRIFAEKIWKLKETNKKYKFIIKKSKNINPKNLIFEYLSIFKKDPQLPNEFLPKDWVGDKAYLIFKKYFPFENKINNFKIIDEKL